MKNFFLGLLAIISCIGYCQVPTYYNDVNINLTGQALQNELSSKIINTHTTFLSYTPGVWDALKQTDLVTGDPSKVILIYGYSDNDGNSTTDRTRGVNNNGGGSTDWNREHVYPKSLGNPNLGTSGPGADAHHLRPSDVQRNSSRGNRKFADGSGNSGITAQGHWYPGDEFKGDVARMMMYMYLRYGSRCLPTNVGVGAVAVSDNNMLQLFLEWNAEDPVSDLELQRNPLLENIQGNRNPFIDNPAFATTIWGGPQAEDRFGNTGGGDTQAPTSPTNLVASSTTETTTQLSWTAAGDNIGVTGYDIVRNNSFLATTSSISYNVSGLTANTTYSFYVIAKDAAGNQSESSNQISITTQNSSGGGNPFCNANITSFPYNESFESGLGEWKQSTSSDDFNWARRSGGTPSNNTGPGAAVSGSYYIYMESSSPNYSNKRAILYSPCFDIISATQASFSFKYHMYGASNMGSLAVEASLDGTNWTSIWSLSGNQGNAWRAATIDLSNYIGQEVQLRFNGMTGTTWQGDIAVDDLSFSTSGGGGTTTEDVNLRITFDNYPEETSWEIRDTNNQLVYAGGTYGSQADGSTINISRSLEQGCYTLIFKDSYGDGICCGYGNGSYELTDSSSAVLVSGGSFGSQQSNNFCLGARSQVLIGTNSSSLEEDNLSSVIEIYPNPVKENIYIKTPKVDRESITYRILNQMGQPIKLGKLIDNDNTIQVNDLSSGLYFVSLTIGSKTVVRKITKE